MANEITLFYESGLDTYAIIRNASGQAWDTAGAAFETWNAMSDYDIALTDKSGSMYLGDFPSTITAGYYTIQKFQRPAASPANDDPCVEAEYGYWTGTVWTKLPYALQSIISTIATILIDTNEVQVDLTNGGRLDLLIDAINLAVGTTIPAAITAISSGSGSIAYEYEVLDNSDNPIPDVTVWVTSDESGETVIVSGTTDDFGKVTFYLDAGTYYFWCKKAGYNFTNPEEVVVSA